MVLLLCLAESVRDRPCYGSTCAAPVTKRALLERCLESVSAIIANLQQVVSDAAAVDRKGSQQIEGGCRGAGAQTGGSRQDAEERIWQCAVGIARIGYRKILIGQPGVIHIQAGLVEDLVIPGKRDLGHHAAAQLLLDAEGVLIGAWHLVPGRIKADAAADAGQSAAAGAQRFKDSIRERVLQRIRPCQACGRSDATIERADVRSGLRKTVGGPELRRGLIVNTGAGPNYGVFPYTPCHTKARRDIGRIGVVNPLWLAIDAGEEETPIDRRRRRRVGISRTGVGLVVIRLRFSPGSNDLVAERALGCGIPTAIQAIEPFLPWYLHVVAQAEIQCQARTDFPVILHISRVVGTRVIERVVILNAPAGGNAEQ